VKHAYTGIVCAILLLVTSLAAAGLQTERETWFDSPCVSVMTGFIYEPKKPYTIHEWKETLGDKFDAERWVKDFKEVGAQHLVFYDKWIDGLVFHNTKTTEFKTKRDFVGELAKACQHAGLPLVLYFNAVSDGNPEFDKWSLLDPQGRPVVFSPNWPTRYQTLYSPFHDKVIEQVRELMSNYGPLHGIWHDIFSERLNTTSEWTTQGYQAMYGEEFQQASGARLAEFNARTLANYLDEVEDIRHAQKQDNCIFTSNGSGGNFLAANVWTREVGSRLHYLFNEGHSFAANEQLARMAWVLPKPLEVNLLLNSSWFTPMDDTAPPAQYTEAQVIAATAITVCQGASVHFALTPGHSGVFGQDLEHAKAAGAWFRQVEPFVKAARPYADVAIVLGTPAGDGPGLPAGAWEQALALGDGLNRAGVFSQFLYDTAQGGNWPTSLSGFSAILIPDLAVLDETRNAEIRNYVRAGGRLLSFGQASMLDAYGTRKRDYALADVLGASYRGELALPLRKRLTQVRADSEYSTEFAAERLIDGQATAWASGGTPMPHWVEMTLPEPIDMTALELVSRQGPYLVTDFDLEVKVQDAWRLVKPVRGARTRTVKVRLRKPVRTQAIRVTLLRERYQGQDRQYADVEAIRVFDTEGQDRSTLDVTRLPLVATDERLQHILQRSPASCTLKILDVQQIGAEVMARLGDAQGPAVMLRHDYGKGEAILVTCSANSLAVQDAFYTVLGRLAVGAPTLVCSDEAKQRLRFILTRVQDKHVLHVIDPVAEGARFQPMDVEVSLNTQALGGLKRVRLIGEKKTLPLSREGHQMRFVLRPNPVASVVLSSE
jgi:hypothetical protein